MKFNSEGREKNREYFERKEDGEAFKLNVFTSSRERGENERLGVKERERR